MCVYLTEYSQQNQPSNSGPEEAKGKQQGSQSCTLSAAGKTGVSSIHICHMKGEQELRRVSYLNVPAKYSRDISRGNFHINSRERNVTFLQISHTPAATSTDAS